MARPTKLTPETHTKIVDAILYGATYKDAAESVGVTYDTFNNWMLEGKEAKSGKFFEFFEAVSKANAECAVNFTRVIQNNAAKGDWKAALEWLKRRRPAEWGDSSKVDMTSNGETLKVDTQEVYESILRKLGLATAASETGEVIPTKPE